MDQVSNQITKLIENLQLPGQFQRREAAITISAAAATVAVAGAMYSLLQKALDDPGCKTVPYTSPLSGSTKEYRKDPKAFIEKWTKELGPVFRAHVFGEVMTVVSGPYIREIFFNNDFNFKHGINKRFNLQLLLGLDHDADTVIPLLRQIVLKHLHNNMKPYTPRVVQQLKKAGDEIMGDVSQEKIFPHVYPIMQHMIANAAASIFVGEKLVKDEKLIESFKNMTLDCGAELQSESVFFEHFSTLNSWRQWIIGKFSKTIQRHKSQLYNALKPEVEERLANINKPGWERPKDILQDLLEDALKNPPRKELVQHLAEWIIQLIFASVHTTSENSTVVMYRILQHPELIPELLEEQNQVLCEYLGEDVVKSTDDAVSLFTFDVVRNLPKLDSVCRESLRLRNDYLTLTHKYMGKSKFTLSNGAVIKPGEYVQINTWFNHTDDKIQHDDFGNRTEFQPFRYVNLQDRQSTKVGDDYLVFGLGKHACPGRWFALQEIKTIVSFFIRQYEISNKSGIIFPTDDVNKLPVGDFVVKKRFS